MQDTVSEQGSLPIRALADEMLKYFTASSPDFAEELANEIRYNGLKSTVVYNNDRAAICTIAELNDKQEIGISEAYVAFMWCVAYAFISYTDGRQVQHFTDALERATKLLDYGLSLFRKWSKWDLNFPNPEQPDPDDPYIEQANALTIISGSFLLGHEYAHHYLGHSSQFSGDGTDDWKERWKADEFDADKTAAQNLLETIGPKRSSYNHTIRLGIVIGVSSMFFLSEDWSGGDVHPDTDERVLRLLDLISDDGDSDYWKYGILIVMLWELYYLGTTTDPAGHGSAKEDLICLITHLKTMQSSASIK